MRSEADGTHLPAFQINLFLACALNGIRMKKDSVLRADGSDFPHGLTNTGFVIGTHDGDENGIRVEWRETEFSQVDKAFTLYIRR